MKIVKLKAASTQDLTVMVATSDWEIKEEKVFILYHLKMTREIISSKIRNVVGKENGYPKKCTFWNDCINTQIYYI